MSENDEGYWNFGSDSSFGPYLRQIIKTSQSIASGSTDASDAEVSSDSTVLSDTGLVTGSTSSDEEIILPIMNREELSKKLREFENKYKVSSQTFYELWEQGNAPEGFETMTWIVLWEAWRDHYMYK